MKKLLVSSLITLSAGLAFAGNGSSGGGNIYGNQFNPWFLHNTKTVSYCLEVAPEFSDISEDKIASMVDEAFGYWARTFSRTTFREYIDEVSGVNLRLGTQNFVREMACAATTDIKFQFGFLSEDQKESWPGYRQLLAGAFRTSYDEVHLRGRGVIYIAPERGALRPRSRTLHPKPWSYGTHNALRFTLIHELGHVFGLQDDHFSSWNLMSSRIVENVTRKDEVEDSRDWNVKSIPSPFGCNNDLEAELYYEVETWKPDPFKFNKNSGARPSLTSARQIPEGLAKILGLPEDYTLHIQTIKQLMNISFEGRDYAKINFTQSRGGEINADEAISLYLTNNQTVFQGIAPESYDIAHEMYSSTRLTRVTDVVLELSNGYQLPVFVNFDQRCWPEIGTVYDGKVVFNIFL